jgi:pantoate--beta-alanine ligase
MTLPVVHEAIEGIRGAVLDARKIGRRVGFVPTMGALHAGHAKLIETARAECDFVVVSIFVNPAQFGPNEDFTRYPRTFDADRELCGRAGADLIFGPMRELIYPPGFRTYLEVGGLGDVLEGASRPGHFRGVATVVLKLFNIVPADVAYFGQKDAQQLLIIRKMVHDLNVPIEISAVPTVREPDGLALSSRNRYLNPAERAAAPVLHRSLEHARQLIKAGERDPGAIERAIADDLAKAGGIRLDYAGVVCAETLERPERLAGRTLIALAAFLGSTRLIDNIQLDIP